jgi:hypothetical protein
VRGGRHKPIIDGGTDSGPTLLVSCDDRCELATPIPAGQMIDCVKSKCPGVTA